MENCSGFAVKWWYICNGILVKHILSISSYFILHAKKLMHLSYTKAILIERENVFHGIFTTVILQFHDKVATDFYVGPPPHYTRPEA